MTPTEMVTVLGVNHIVRTPVPDGPCQVVTVMIRILLCSQAQPKSATDKITTAIAYLMKGCFSKLTTMIMIWMVMEIFGTPTLVVQAPVLIGL